MNRNIIATILVVLAVGIYFTVTKTMLDEAKAIQVVNAQYTTAMNSADQLIKVRDQVLKDYNNLSTEDRERLNKMLPNTVDNIRLVIDLNNVAQQHGFSLKNIRATAASAGSAAKGGSSPSTLTPTQQINMNNNSNTNIAAPVLDTVSVSFSLSAPYLQFINFMQSLEANLRVMDLTHMTMTANDTGTYDYSVEFRTYWLRSQ
ncbi:MAG: hypothetical protein WCP09_03580 [Candidatus Taylorbacteria bacterium]